MKHTTILLGWAAIALTATLPTRAEEPTPAHSPSPTSRDLNLKRVQQNDATRHHQYGSRPDYLVKPGLLADRSNRVVHVEAESLRLKSGDPVEFPLITLGSGKDYEALAVSFASAMDLYHALKFIGLQPGHGVDATKLNFWPQGDRIRVRFHYSDGTASNAVSRTLPAEQLIIDTRTSKTLPEVGFTFTGSEWLPASLEPGTGLVFAADAFSPGGIVSVYNDSATVLDIPRQASQSEVYTYQVPNPAVLLPANQLIEITFEPFYRDTLPHRLGLSLQLSPAPGETNSDCLFTLSDESGRVLNTNRTAHGFLAALETASGNDRELHLQVRPADTLTVTAIQKALRLLSTLDREQGVRISAPPPGHPYYKAFLPDEKLRVRENRFSQAPELHLNTRSGVTTGYLAWLEMEWKEGSEIPVIHATNNPVTSPRDLEAALKTRPEAPKVMLVFTPGTSGYGAIRDYLAPLLTNNMILYVFAD